jgi:membrane protein YdbS with pleckstrin-like domain
MSDSPQLAAVVPPPLAISRVGSGLVCAAALLSALGVLVMALFMGAQPYWLVVGMELCIAMAGVFGLLFVRGRFAEGPALALLCVAGTIFAAGFLSWLAVRSGIKLKGDKSVSLTSLMFARVAISAALVALASVEVLRRNRRSLGLLARAAATGVPLAIIAGGLYAGWAALASQQVVPAWIVWTLVSVAVVVAMALLCACGHFVIRAFEMGRPENAANNAPLPASPASAVAAGSAVG